MTESSGRLLVVSNRLPVSLSYEEKHLSASPASGGLVTALSPVLRDRGGFWAGWPGDVRNVSLREVREMLEPLSAESGYRLLPVMLTRKDMEDFYHGFSNSVLWPLFHDLQSRCSFSPSHWDGYIRANEKFALVAEKHSRPEDFIWVNDYQLIPLGAMLQKRNPALTSSFFLHIPFPSVDIFMKMPKRKEILIFLMAYSFVCFQTPRDKRNFLDCLRVFFPDMKIGGRGHISKFSLEGKTFLVGDLPISIDFKAFTHLGSSRKVIARSRQIREEIRGDRFILGVDRLDYSKGIPQKLRGFQRALELFPELREKMTLYQLVVPSREAVEEYKALKEEIELLVSRINGKYGTTRWIPVNWRYGSVPKEELAALYRAADMLLVTSLKDGMNLVSKEYCASKGRDAGVLILSEFAGAALQLARGAVLVNPYDEDAIAASLLRGFTMEEGEKRRRMNFMRKSIARQNVFWWVDNFLRAASGKKLSDFSSREIPTLWPGIEENTEA